MTVAPIVRRGIQVTYSQRSDLETLSKLIHGARMGKLERKHVVNQPFNGSD